MGAVISNQPFTRQAQALAAANHILLIGDGMLDEMLADVDGTVPVMVGLLSNVPIAGSGSFVSCHSNIFPRVCKDLCGFSK